MLSTGTGLQEFAIIWVSSWFFKAFLMKQLQGRKLKTFWPWRMDYVHVIWWSPANHRWECRGLWGLEFLTRLPHLPTTQEAGTSQERIWKGDSSKHDKCEGSDEANSGHCQPITQITTRGHSTAIIILQKTSSIQGHKALHPFMLVEISLAKIGCGSLCIFVPSTCALCQLETKLDCWIKAFSLCKWKQLIES